jgi:hypothetical protein
MLLEDGDGRLHKVEGTTAGLMTGAGQRIEVALTRTSAGSGSRSRPAKLEGVELSFRMPADMTGIGTLDVLGVDASDSPTGDADWRDIGWKPSSNGFHWTAIRSGTAEAYRPPPGSPNRIAFGFDEGQMEPIFGDGGGALFRSSTTPSMTCGENMA